MCIRDSQYRSSNQTQSSQFYAYQSNSINSGPQAGGQAESGESLDWWFPWEMDGGGGGGVSGGVSMEIVIEVLTFMLDMVEMVQVVVL